MVVMVVPEYPCHAIYPSDDVNVMIYRYRLYDYFVACGDGSFLSNS